jgi:hypothetical protein
VRLGILPEALKRRNRMNTKQELELVIASWPDENGVSSNPEFYEDWELKQNQYFQDKVYMALGGGRINMLSKRQIGFLNRCLSDLKNRKSVFSITLEEIIGQYELVTEHLSPSYLEDAIEAHTKRKKMH